MSDGVIVAIITSATSLLLAVVNIIVAAIKNRKDKKSGVEKKLDRIEERLNGIEKRLDGMETTQKKQTEHDNLQYMSILRLTVMDSDMPMSERLIAGKEYLARNGNGDVKAFYQELERKVNTDD